jgi:hypothetical protein
MVAKTMDERKFCDNCMQKHDCQSVYRQLGDIEGPSVVIKVIVAFLLPLLVFIVSLAIFEKILGGAISTDQLRTALSLPAALLITFIFILIARVINRRFGQFG